MTSMDAPPPWHNDSKRIGIVVLLVGVLILATACRWYASLDDFWLDEIWSWTFATQVESASEVFTSIRHDNNHFLNTWIIYTLGSKHHWTMYRLPAVLAGVGTIGLAWTVARRWGTVEAITALLMTSGSFLLIQYSSEARGYAYVLLFSVASLELMQRALDRNSWLLDLSIGVVAVLGFLSHLTYLYCYTALAVWSIWSVFQRAGSLRILLARTLRWYLLPTIFLVWLYVTNVRNMDIGGGDPSDLSKVIATIVSLSVGGPMAGVGAALVSLVVAFGTLAGLYVMYRAASNLWIFFVSSIVVFPALILIVKPPEFLYPRYFLVSALFIQLLLCFVLGQIYRQKKLGKVCYVLFTLAILLANCVHTARLLRDGRGQYQAALRFLDERTTNPVISIRIGHVLRDGMVIEFYKDRIIEPGRLVYFNETNVPRRGPEWLLLHSFDQPFSPRSRVFDEMNGNTYYFVKVFPYSGLSGWHWAVYRNENGSPPVRKR